MSNAKRRRAYIGNLRPRPNLSHNLYNNLFLPHGLHVKNYPPDDINGDNGSGIVVVAPKMSNNRHHYAETKPSSHYALVEFDDVGYAIQILNGVVFDGRTLRVSKENTNFGNGGGGRGRKNNMGGGFGSSRWAGDDGGGGSRLSRQKHKESRPNGWDSNSPSTGMKTNKIPNNYGQNKPTDICDIHDLNGEEAIIKGVESVISSEIKESSDEVTAAIACAATMTLLSSMDAFGLDDEEEDSALNDTITINESNVPEKNCKSNVDINIMTSQDFKSRCRVPLAELLAEYGEQDVDWKKKQQPNQTQDVTADNEKDATNNDDFRSRCQMPLSVLMTEYGEQDVDWKKDQSKPSSALSINKQHNAKNATNPKPQSAPREHKHNDGDNNNSMLAHFSKASIHLELVSFGYKYGAPPHSKRGFTYAHPLPPLDVRDLDRAPGHLAKFTGLSHLVKRALLNPSVTGNDGPGEGSSEKEDEEVKTGSRSQQSPMRRRANKIADEIIKVLVESIDEGGHGAISPVTMTISVGSEYGRHRAVVLVEHLAVVLRARLRRNDGRCFNEDTGGLDDSAVSGKNNGIVRQPVSIGTRHRDVDARHRDEEAYGEDLKREARKAEKQQMRRLMVDGDCDDGCDP